MRCLIYMDYCLYSYLTWSPSLQIFVFFFLMIRDPPRSTPLYSSAASDVYKRQGGVFKFNKFYKQIAVAYGLGLRLDLDFFILRFDGGMKAVNPAFETKKEHFPIIHPKFSRDFAFHFAVGYPF